MATGQKHNGIAHGRNCACPRCDPGQARLAAQRAAALVAAHAPAPAVAAAVIAPPPPRSSRWAGMRYQNSGDTRTARLRAHLRAGKTFDQAAQLIEAEFSPNAKGNPHAEEDR